MRHIYLLLAVILSLCACQSETVDAPTPMPTDTVTVILTTATAIVPTLSPTDEPITDGQADADVQFVRVVATGDDTYTFHVTIAHPDTGWDDYADGWDVVLPDGTVVKSNPDDPFTRLLLHPHETEQPFTRSQTGVVISAEISTVTVRAHDLVDGFGGKEIVVDLGQNEGEGFKIER